MRILSVTPATLTVDFENTPPADRVDLLDVCDIGKDHPRWLPLLTGQESICSINFSARLLKQGGGFVRVAVTSTYLEPYLQLLEQRTGGTVSHVPLSFLERWTHTYFIESCAYHDGLVHAIMVVRVYPPTNVESITDEERQTRAVTYATRYLDRELGDTDIIQEFIPADEMGRLYKRNPAYGRGESRLVSRAVNERAWQAVFHAWVEHQASPAHIAILERQARASTSEHWPSLRHYVLHLDQYRTTLQWEEFRAGVIPPVPNSVEPTLLPHG